MNDILNLINAIPVEQWDYYDGIINPERIDNPFTDHLGNHNNFIKKYFVRGGKSEVMKSSGINVGTLRLPNHINSVFFLGIMFYNNTSLHKKYKLGNNDPGYKSFPFIWFLIALFHDNAYEMEDKAQLTKVKSIDDLYKRFDIDYFLLDKKFKSRCHIQLDSRTHYFNYRKNEWGVVDHGILGGILLYDKLVKIRIRKKADNKDNLFWGKKLENQYLLAANAISLHNIWMPEKDTETVYRKYGLENLIGIPKVKFSDFPLFYLLAIVDTIEPLKTFREDVFSDFEILKSINLTFSKDSVIISKKAGTNINFNKIIAKAHSLDDWLDIEIKIIRDSVELIFHY